MDKFETRPCVYPGVDVRADVAEDGTRTIEGLAVPYNQLSDLIGGQFREKFAPGSFGNVLRGLDTVYLRNHNRDKIIARTSNGTLKVWETVEGIRYKATPAADTSTVRDTIADIQAGNLEGNSFAFKISPGGDSWARGEDGVPVRTVTEAAVMRDISTVTDPTYPQTDVAVRSLETWETDQAEPEADEPILDILGALAQRDRVVYLLDRK